MQFPRLTPTVRAILIVLLVVFLGQTLVEGVLHVPISQWAALLPGLHVGLAWQWATYWLIESPGQVLQRALDMLFLYFLLSPFEERFGARRLLQLVAAGVIGGALPVMLLGIVLPSAVSGLAGATSIGWAGFGAFAVVSGGGAVAFLFLPPMSAWAALGIFLAIPALSAAWTGDATQFLAAVGGASAGILYARWMARPATKKPGASGPLKRGRPNLTVIEGGADDNKPRWLN